MKNALIAAIVAAAVAGGSASATLTRPQVVRIVGATSSVPAGSQGFAWAACPGHLKATGGGLVGEPFSTVPLQLNGSYALPGDNTWEVAATNTSATSATIQAMVICTD